jgi:hypothetical protein
MRQGEREMMKIVKWVLVGALIYGLASPISCSGRHSEDADNIAARRVLFHISYENYAWGYTGYGYYIDDQGDVWKMTTPNHWWQEAMDIIENKDNGPIYEARSLEQSYVDSRDSVVSHIDLDALREKSPLIEAAAKGDYSTPVSTGADLGSWIYGCLHYDEATDKYEKVILSVSGDWTANNMDPSAATLDEWLKSSVIGCPFPFSAPETD